MHANGHLSRALRAPVRSKSFLDRALLDEDLSRFTALPALLALNAFELALLVVKLVCRRCLCSHVLSHRVYTADSPSRSPHGFCACCTTESTRCLSNPPRPSTGAHAA
jgi:hypothetical protein